MINIAVITISDRAYKGEYEDKSGKKIIDILKDSEIEINIDYELVPDDKEMIKNSIVKHNKKDYIITTGGTGISPRDFTPDVTKELCDKELPGISEMLRFESYKETKNAVFSRGFSGVMGKTIIINFPGSVKAVTLCTNLVLPILEHGKKMIEGGKH